MAKAQCGAAADRGGLSRPAAVAWVLCVLLAALPLAARAQPSRAVLAPSSEAPARLVPGEVLVARVRVASGLTPPPGLQQRRARRGFGAYLCARGVAAGLPEDSCVALDVADVRPVASHTLDYLVSIPVPTHMAEGAFDLGLRFPGGEQRVARAVWLGKSEVNAPAEVTRLGPALFRVRSGAMPARARFHVAAGRAVRVEGDIDAAVAPFLDERGAFSAGQVLSLALGPQHEALVRLEPGGSLPNWTLRLPSEVLAGQDVTPVVVGEPAPERCFLRFEVAEDAEVDLPFRVPGPAMVEAFVSAGGQARVLRAQVRVEPRRVGGCDISSFSASGQGALGLLLGSISWTLRRRRRFSAVFAGRTRQRNAACITR